MFCKNCGAQLDDSTVFCTQCGIRLVKTPAAKSGSAEPAEAIKPPAGEISASAAETAPTEPLGNIPIMGTIPTSGVGGEADAPRSAETPSDAGAFPNTGAFPNAETFSGGEAPVSRAENYELPPAAAPVKEKTCFGVGALIFCLIIIGALSIATGVFAGLYFSAIS